VCRLSDGMHCVFVPVCFKMMFSDLYSFFRFAKLLSDQKVHFILFLTHMATYLEALARMRFIDVLHYIIMGQ